MKSVQIQYKQATKNGELAPHSKNYFLQQFLYFTLEPQKQVSFRPNLVVLIQDFCDPIFTLSPLISPSNPENSLRIFKYFSSRSLLWSFECARFQAQARTHAQFILFIHSCLQIHSLNQYRISQQSALDENVILSLRSHYETTLDL